MNENNDNNIDNNIIRKVKLIKIYNKIEKRKNI